MRYILICLLLITSACLLLGEPTDKVSTNAGVEESSDLPSADADTSLNTKRPDGVSKARWEQFLNYYCATKAADNRPIEFYGKVEDENGTPVDGVTVRVRVSSFLESPEDQWQAGGGQSASESLDLLTDGSGLFALSDTRGRVLYIDSLTKDGFEDVFKYKRTYLYGQRYGGAHAPDRDQPEVIQLMCKRETEPLIRTECLLRVKSGDQKYGIDLIEGRSQTAEGFENPHLIIAMKIASPSNGRYEWSVSFESPSGGLIVAEDSPITEAPKEGYRPIVEWGSLKKDAKWSLQGNRNIYYRSEDGRMYAAIRARVFAYHDGIGRVDLVSLINPRGSRNLVYDPKKEMK